MPDDKAIIQSEMTVNEVHLALHLKEWSEIAALPVVTIRGLLGHALMRLQHPDLPGDERLIPADSLYWPLFKPEGQLPLPYLVDCDPGNGLALELRARIRFWGRGATWYPVVLDALENSERLGFGASQVPYRMEVLNIQEVRAPWQEDWPTLESCRCRLELITPARLKEGGALINRESDIIRVLAFSVLRRIRELSETYGGGAKVDMERFHQQLDNTRLTRMAFQMSHDRRTSSRTQEEVSIGGIHGWCEVEGPSELLRVFQAGTFTAIGGKVASGCGRLRFHEI